MPIRLELPPTFGEQLENAKRPLAGMWLCSGSPLVAEICAGAGLDWLLVDAEHAPLGLESIQRQLQAVAPYPVTPVVRLPACDRVLIKQYLDLGAQNLLVPMVDDAEQAREAVAACRYPPAGVRGVGSALARGARWNRVEGYLGRADALVSVMVQIESEMAVRNVAEIARVDGLASLFIGPSDLAASMGLLGQQDHPEVIAAVERSISAARDAGVPAGVNAFDPRLAERYLAAGASFLLTGADVAMLARGSEALADRWCAPDEQGEGGSPRASY